MKDMDQQNTTEQSANNYIVKDKDVSFKQTRAISNLQQVKLFKSIGLAISFALVITAFEWKSYDPESVINLGSLDAEFEEILDIPVTVQEPPPPPKVVTPEIIEVPDEEEIEQEIEVDLDIEVTEETVIEDVVFKEAPEEEVTDEIFDIVEEQASPVGGMTKFFEYFATNLKYPAAARSAGVEGKVYIQFVVDRNGEIAQVKVLKGIGYGCDEEAVRVMKKAPNWNPAKQRGRAVSSRVTLPLVFQLT